MQSRGRSDGWRRWEAESSWSTGNRSTACSAKQPVSSCLACARPEIPVAPSCGRNPKTTKEEAYLKPIVYRFIAICAALASLGTISMTAAQGRTPRLELAADSDWRFLLGDPSGAEARAFADRSWRTVNLPHDWSIEGAPDKNSPTGSGGGFFPAGTGWYRKTFSSPPEWKKKRVSIEFDGVYKDATVYLNGHKLGTHPYGYT